MALVGECEMIKVVLSLKGYGKGLSMHLLEMIWKEKSLVRRRQLKSFEGKNG